MSERSSFLMFLSRLFPKTFALGIKGNVTYFLGTLLVLELHCQWVLISIFIVHDKRKQDGTENWTAYFDI